MSTIKESWLKPTKSPGDCEDVDKISQLPDELLEKVLSFLPTKAAVRTSILSKRWEFLWMWLPKLEFDSIHHPCSSRSERHNLRNFIDLNLPLHRAPVIEIFRLEICYGPIGIIKHKNIELWVAIAVSRCLRELSLDLYNCIWPTLPSSLYACKSLVILKLKNEIIVDVPRMAYLPSLKTLLLQHVTYSDEKSLHQLLSKCPVLEDLVVERNYYDGFRTMRVIVPSLQRLTLNISRTFDFDELVINTPFLKYFKVWFSTRPSSYSSFNFKDMPKLEEADIELVNTDINKFIRSIIFVKRLSLCVIFNAEEALYREGIVFNQLEHLKICPCQLNWSKLLVRLLEDSPNLRELEICLNDDHLFWYVDPPVCWENEPKCVPKCLLRSLETFKWTGIRGTKNEMDLAKYIFRNAWCLKTATILFHSSLDTEDKRETMMQELLLLIKTELNLLQQNGVISLNGSKDRNIVGLLIWKQERVQTSEPSQDFIHEQRSSSASENDKTKLEAEEAARKLTQSCRHKQLTIHNRFNALSSLSE